MNEHASFPLHRPLSVASLLIALAAVSGCGSGTNKGETNAGQGPPAGPPPASAPALSTVFSTVAEEAYSTYQMPGDGDLWPSCWADDDNLYAAAGDGSGLDVTSPSREMSVNRVSGVPPQLKGTTLTGEVGTNWSGSGFSRKPTGMLCTNSTLYLAFQNLDSTDYNSAPAASIAKSVDHGGTWTWDKAAPMFGGARNAPLFTTIFFLDYGKNSSDAMDQYVYAYGLDNNWRAQQALYLARVPANSVQTRSTWEFYTGTDANGTAGWTSEIAKKQPVLLDTRQLYPVRMAWGCPANDPVISQGGVVYDKPLRRYLFSSWSCSTHELYESPAPWGPWKLVLSNDVGPLRLKHNRGQYGTSIPSKFISADGKTLYLQSNICCSGDGYTFSLRKIYLELPLAAYPGNTQSTANLALAPGVRAVSKSTHYGSLCGVDCSNQLNNGVLDQSEDDFDQEVKALSWWGVVWPQPYTFDQVVYETGNVSSDGGWFAGNLQVQTYQNGAWVQVAGNVRVSPTYTYNQRVGSHTTYTFEFPATSGMGVRVAGTPGGPSHYSSVAQLGVYYGGKNLLANPGFEGQSSSTILGPWQGEGSDMHSVDVAAGVSHSGMNGATIRSSSDRWNGLAQTVSVQSNTNYILTGWVQNNFSGNKGLVGVRGADGATVLEQSTFGAATKYIPVTVKFNSGDNSSVTVFVGFAGKGADLWLRVDDMTVR